ncbi:glycosyltransferase [Photobacterium andalusiense]|uniref:Putative glycosyl transferase n=1 Tax=Photobacterium andalusiense TaxID=2204296 RepID=A0A1Y6MFH8_9GAMM|nr:glycosyltransferase [Photobacterium andalusiense]SMY35232.1 putative glycosyl transferase [Photobacterium andalusiense]
MASKIKIINFVPEELPSYRPDVDVLYSKELPKQGVETTIVGIPKKEAIFIKGNDTTLMTSKKMSNKHLDSLAYFFNACKLSLQAKKDGYDVIQARDMVWVGLFTLLAAKLTKLPFTYWVSFLYAESRTMRAKDKNENIPRWKRPILLAKGLIEEFVLYRFILPHSDRVYVQSDFMFNYMKNKGVDPKTMMVVPMGVDFDKIDESVATEPKYIPQWQDSIVIGYLGSLDRLRKLETIVQAFKQAKEQVPNLKLLFVGDSEITRDRECLIEEAQKLGVADDFIITGWVPTQEAWAYLKGVDMVIGFMNRGLLLDVSTPTKAMEYMALKKAMICNDSPDQQYVIEQSHCGRVTDGSSESYANAMIDLAQNPMSEQELDAGYNYIKNNRSYSYLGQQVADDIKNVLNKHNAL